MKIHANRFRRISCFAFFLAGMPIGAFAADGNELYGWIASPDPSTQLRALGYIQGVLDQDYFTSQAEKIMGEQGFPPGPLHHVCRPKGQTGQQIVDIVRRELEQHPEDRTQPGAQIVWGTFRKAFPCTP